MSWSCASCSGSNPDDTRFCGHCGAPKEGGAMRPETRPALRDERRLVTALFADISGFSELAARLDAERLQEVIDPVIAALSNVVGRYEGVIEKYAGDALMALFGAPVAHDDDAARALHTALDMHRELARLVPQLPPEAANLRLHIGVNSGHGIARVIGSEVRFDYAVLGDVVVLAQRLEAATPVGETYVGAATQQLTARDFELEPVGELAVKGKQEPVPAWRLVGPRSHREHAPAAAADARALVGRDQEMGAMNRFSARLEEGAGGAVFVLGEAGVGKTTLCQSLRARAVAQGWDWLAARCLSYGGELAYWPYADLLRRTLGTVDLAPSEALDRVTAELAAAGLEDSLPFIGSLMGLEGAPAAEISPQGFQRRLHESVVALLAARARARPTILMLDDLHWADGPTVTLTGELLAAVERLPLALVVSARPEGGATVDTLISRRPESCLRLDLQPLAADAVREIAAQVLAVPPAAELVQALLEHTGGNPFFVEEVARSLAQRGGLVERGGEWHTPAGWEQEQVPLSVEGVIAARIDALTATERSVLEVLSVVGRRADLMLARAVADVDPALPALTGVGLLDDVDPGGRHIAFHHPLTQQVVYARLLRRRRVELHRAVGEAAESLLGAEDGSVDLLARHFYVGEDAPRAFDYALRAAARAERLFANEQAIAYLKQALELEERATGGREQRREILLRQAHLEEVGGALEAALAHYQEVADATGDLRATLGIAATLRKQGDYGRVLAVVGEARDRPGLTAVELAGLALEEGSVWSIMGDIPRAIEVLEGALAALGSGLDTSLRGRLLITLARAEQTVERGDQALVHAEQACACFEQDENLDGLVTALRVLGGVIQGATEDDRTAAVRARETLERALALARRVGNAEETGACLINLGRVVQELGLFEDALRYDTEAVEAFQTIGVRAGVACGYCNLAQDLAFLRRWEEALEAAQHGLAVAREIGSEIWITGGLNGSALAMISLGRHREAQAAAAEAIARSEAAGFTDRLRYALGFGIEAHLALGENDEAGELERRLAALDA